MKKKKTFEKIREIISKIPKGKVTTYGDIAKALKLKDARLVGWALWGNQNPDVPCHRIVKKGGFLAKNYSLGGWQEQKRRLKNEGIDFIKKDQVDLQKHYYQILGPKRSKNG